MLRAVAIVAASLSFWSCSRNGSIIVGSKNFTESLILGEIAAQQLERKLHIRVDRKLDLGGTLLTHEAIVKGDIDIYPEYTGTGSSVILKQSIPDDPLRAYMAVKDAYLKRFRLVWLPPLGFNDTFAIVIRTPDAQKLPVPTLSAAAAARSWRLGVGYEFVTRPDGLRKLDQVYGFRWNATPKSMDLGLLYRALKQGQVDMVSANSTDARFAQAAYTVLEDDKRAFPPYNACYVVRKALLDERQAVGQALTMLSNHVTADMMRSMNRKVDIDHQPVAKVAQEFLATQE